MDLQEQFGRDDEKVENGVWYDFGEASLKIRYDQNEDYQNYLRSKAQDITQLPNSSLEDDVAEDLFIKGFARHILVDWENLKLDGEELEYNTENAEKVLREFPEFRNLVSNKASDLSNYQSDKKDEDIKN